MSSITFHQLQVGGCVLHIIAPSFIWSINSLILSRKWPKLLDAIGSPECSRDEPKQNHIGKKRIVKISKVGTEKKATNERKIYNFFFRLMLQEPQTFQGCFGLGDVWPPCPKNLRNAWTDCWNRGGNVLKLHEKNSHFTLLMNLLWFQK